MAHREEELALATRTFEGPEFPPRVKRPETLANDQFYYWTEGKGTLTERDEQVLRNDPAVPDVLRDAMRSNEAIKHIAKVLGEGTVAEIGMDPRNWKPIIARVVDYLRQTKFLKAKLLSEWPGVKKAMTKVRLMHRYAYNNRVEVTLNAVDAIAVLAQLQMRSLDSRGGSNIERALELHNVFAKTPTAIRAWKSDGPDFICLTNVPADYRTDWTTLPAAINRRGSADAPNDGDTDDEEMTVGSTATPSTHRYREPERPVYLAKRLNEWIGGTKQKTTIVRERTATVEYRLDRQKARETLAPFRRAFFRKDASQSTIDKAKTISDDLLLLLPDNDLFNMMTWAQAYELHDLSSRVGKVVRGETDQPRTTEMVVKRTHTYLTPHMWGGDKLLKCANTLHDIANWPEAPDTLSTLLNRVGNCLVEINYDTGETMRKQDQRIEKLESEKDRLLEDIIAKLDGQEAPGQKRPRREDSEQVVRDLSTTADLPTDQPTDQPADQSADQPADQPARSLSAVIRNHRNTMAPLPDPDFDHIEPIPDDTHPDVICPLLPSAGLKRPIQKITEWEDISEGNGKEVDTLAFAYRLLEVVPEAIRPRLLQWADELVENYDGVNTNIVKQYAFDDDMEWEDYWGDEADIAKQLRKQNGGDAFVKGQYNEAVRRNQIDHEAA